MTWKKTNPQLDVQAILDAAISLRMATPLTTRESFDRWLIAGLLAGDLESLARKPHRDTQIFLRSDDITRTLSIMSLAGAGTGRAADKRRLLASWISRFGGMCSLRDIAEGDEVLAAWSPSDPSDRLLFELTASNDRRVRTFFHLAANRHGLDETMQTLAWLRSKPSTWIREAIRIGVPEDQIQAGADRIFERARLSPALSGWPGEDDTDLPGYQAEAAAGLAMLGRFDDALSLLDGPIALHMTKILLSEETPRLLPGLSAAGCGRFATDVLDRALTRDGRWAPWQRRQLTSNTYTQMRPPKTGFAVAVMADGRLTAGVLSTFHYHQNWSIDKKGLALAIAAMPPDLLRVAMREGGPKRLQALKEFPEIAPVLERKALRAIAARSSSIKPRAM